MDLKRFFASRIEDGYAYLTEGEYTHAVQVVRLKAGYKLIVCDNSGYDHYCTIEEISGHPGKRDRSQSDCFVKAKIDKSVASDTETEHYLTLYIGNNKNLDEVVQKAVELGVKRIVPFFSQHCNIDKINKSRLESIVLESSKQCGRSVLAKVDDLRSFDEIGEDDEEIYAFYEFEKYGKLKDLPPTEKKKIGIVIGCEGGFSALEYEIMKQKGFHTLTLGKSILRVSTAVVSAVTLVKDKLGEI